MGYITYIYMIFLSAMLVSCLKPTSKSTSTESTNSPYLSKLIFDKNSGVDKHYNFFGPLPIKIDKLDTTININIYESLDQTIRLSLPFGWHIQESQRMVLSSVANCKECYFSIIEHDPVKINMDLKSYLNEVLNQLKSDSTNIQENLHVESYPALDIDNYNISGNQRVKNQLIGFVSRIIEFEGKIYDITLSQSVNHMSKLNEHIFEIIFNSLIIRDKSLFPKDMEIKYNLTYDSN